MQVVDAVGLHCCERPGRRRASGGAAQDRFICPISQKQWAMRRACSTHSGRERTEGSRPFRTASFTLGGFGTRLRKMTRCTFSKISNHMNVPNLGCTFASSPPLRGRCISAPVQARTSLLDGRVHRRTEEVHRTSRGTDMKAAPSVRVEVCSDVASLAPAPATRPSNVEADAAPVDVSAEGEAPPVPAIPREQARRLRRSRESSESIEELGRRLSKEEMEQESVGSGSRKSRKSRDSTESLTEGVNKLDFTKMSAARKNLFVQELSAELCSYCKQGNLEMVRAILDKDEEKCPQVVALLGSQGKVSIDARTPAGETPLVCATDSGKLEMVQLILERGALVNKPAKDGVTALHSAAGFGRLQLVRFLVSQGAESAVDDEGDNPEAYAQQVCDSRAHARASSMRLICLHTPRILLACCVRLVRNASLRILWSLPSHASFVRAPPPQFDFTELVAWFKEFKKRPTAMREELMCEFNPGYAEAKAQRDAAERVKRDAERKRKEEEEKARLRKEREAKDKKALQLAERKRQELRDMKKIL